MRLVQKHLQTNGKGLGKIQSPEEKALNTRLDLWDYYDENWEFDEKKNKWVTPELYALPESNFYRKRWDDLYGPMYNKLDSARNILLDYYDTLYNSTNQNTNYNFVGDLATELGALLIPNDTLFGRTLPDTKDPKVKENINRLHSLINKLNVSKLDKILPKIKEDSNYFELAKYASDLGIQIKDIPALFKLASFGDSQLENGISF